MDKQFNRRHFLASAAGMATAAAGMFAMPAAFAAAGRERVRIGMIGTGMRGQVLLRELLRRDEVEVAARGDIKPVMLGKALAMADKAGKPRPRTFGENGDRHAYRAMLDSKALDAVIIATPWEWHASMAIDA